jgi:hypothetical protein
VTFRRRHLYVLLFAVPALLASVIAAALIVAASAGVLWLFVLGDNPWPPGANTLLGAAFLLGSTAAWAVLMTVAYRVGKQQEAQPALNRRHVALSIGATVLLAALIAARTLGLGVAGPRTDSERCADFCQAQGLPGSGTPPRDSGDRTCTCYDAQGRPARQVSISDFSN